MDTMNTLDWKALKAFVAKRKPVEVSAGILNDWFWTAAIVYENGKWKRKHNAYTTSSWATPGFKATMKNGDVVEVAAYIKETPAQAEQRAKAREKARQDLKEVAQKLRLESAQS